MRHMAHKIQFITEYGDFQTPDELARQVVAVLKASGIDPAAVVEPSCGLGSFLAAAADAFPRAELFGLEINSNYISAARRRLTANECVGRLTLVQDSFFNHDWSKELVALPSPLLVLGNPPWVTNAQLGTFGSKNLPAKTNSQKMRGLDALTGKSNFDISEWMLQRNLDWLTNKTGWLAVLCKLAVARKVLAYAWKTHIPVANARVYRIDTIAHFRAAVEACLLVNQQWQ
jgi:methylase of polypeptide subunit release factors